MKKTIDANIGGMAYKLDEDAFERFNSYLNDVSSRLNDADRQEVLEDIEARVAELLNKQILLSSLEVVSKTMIETIISQIGSPEAFGEQKRPASVPKKVHPRSGLSPLAKVLLICLGLVFGGPLLFVLFILFVVFGSLGIALAVPGTMLLCVLAVVVIPVYALIHTIVCYMRERRGPDAKFWIIVLILWLLSIGGSAYMWHNSHLEWSDFSNAIEQLDQLDDEYE